MVCKIFLSPLVKRCALVTYKYGIYELTHELPNDLRLSILENEEISEKCLNLMDDSLVPSFPTKMKILSILEKGS